MIIWLDAQLSPKLAPWIQSTLGVECCALKDIGLRDATDEEIFEAAAKSGAVVMTKDSDFVTLHYHRGAPPQIIWITCGNTSNRQLQNVLTATLPQALQLLQAGDNLVEINGP